MGSLLDLIRLRNAVISFLGVYIGALVFSPGMAATHSYWLAALSAALVLGGGNALNDYFDVEIDRVNRPKRPIPSGRVSRSDAFMLSMAFFLTGLGVAKSINDLCLAIALINTVILILYAAYGKKMLIWSNVCVSYLVASVFVYGAASVYSPDLVLTAGGVKLLITLTVCAFLLNFSREVVKDIEDVEGDRLAYSVTLPIKYGADAAKNLAAAAAVAAVVMSLVPVLSPSDNFNELIYGLLVLVTDAVALASFTTPPNLNQRFLIVSMVTALLAFLLGILTPSAF